MKRKKEIHRISGLPTLRIKPREELSLLYRGKTCQGVKGDTVATGLYANGIRIFSRSIKYHRPRGLYSLDGESANCLMDIDGVPNVHAELTPLRDGMNVRPQNVVGSPEIDLKGFMDKLHWAMPAGFYYRYFHKPYRLWPFFLSQIRKTAGIGVVDPSFRMEGRFDEQYLNGEVCVIGAGPAGMRAALAAAEQGLRVILLEARPWLGGAFDYRAAEYSPGLPLYKRGWEISKRVEKHPQVRVFTYTPVVGLYNSNHVTAYRVGTETDPFDQRYMEIRAQSVIVATGCMERPLVFENNERPGVMQIGCAHRLARTYGLPPGECVVFSVGHDLGLEAALDLIDLGVHISCVADCRTDGQDPRLLDALSNRKIPLLMGWVALKAHGKTLRKVTLGTTDGTRSLDFDCDTLVASAGLSPANGLLSLAQARMTYNKDIRFFLAEALPPKMHVAGGLLGLENPEAIETSGHLAGLEAAAEFGFSLVERIKEAREKLQDLEGPRRGSELVRATTGEGKSFICFDTDTTVENVYQACDMGFDRVELAKRFTAAGTGPGQGGIPGHNLPLVLSQYLESSGPELPSTIRPPLRPTLMATYAGSHNNIVKRTPTHESQEKSGAIFRRIGAWERARYFSQDFNSREEIENVRNNVGIIDVSTLGKFRIFGPDALKALQRVYVGDMAKIPEGKVKYSAMCNEDGCLIDDGVVVKRGENDYYFTTSTGRADSTIEWIRYHTRYEGWNFHLVNLTDAFGAINLAGPNARAVLGSLTDADISRDAFPFPGYREFAIEKGIPVRVMRLGFVGELSYEIHMPASYMQTVWDLLLDAGGELGIGPFGLEAQNALRLEKGHVIIGQESEIRATLHDLGLGFLWHRTKPETKTVGAPALGFTEHQEGRMKLVGFEMENPFRTPKDGAIIVDDAIRGHVFTARYSFTLDKSIGFALVEEELTDLGTRLAIFEEDMGKNRLYARVVSTPFYDPEGNRLKM
jgi:sarcosine oxidase subunit alpha